MVEQLHLDVSECVWCFSNLTPGIWIAVTILYLLVNFIHFAPISGGMPGIFTILTFRSILPYIHAEDYFPYVKYGLTVFLIYIFFLSKIHLFNFMYKCQILANLFAAWNERFEYILHLGKYHTHQTSNLCFS